MLVPTRFKLPAAELAGALAVAGITPEPASTLPAPAALKQAKRVLGGRGVLDDSGSLVPELDTALRVAAAPSREVSVRVVRAGATSVKETLLVRSAGRPEVVAIGSDGTDHDLVVTPNHHQAVVLIDELLSITDLVTGAGTELLELDLPALAALAALADAATAGAYTSRLERRPAPTDVLASLENLTALWDQGVAHDDTRWTVTAVRAVAPVDLVPVREHLADGLATLLGLGLVTGSGDAARTTERGRYIATVLGQLIVVASIGLTVIDGGQRVPVGPVSVLRTATTIWLGSWSQPAGGEPRITLAELTAGGALAVVCDLIEEIVPPARAAAPAPAPAPAPVQAAAAAPAPAVAPAWAPTHRVPAGGMPVWAAPDPAQPSIEHLGERLEVHVAEELGAWSRVVCENGWTGWVDGRNLEPLH